MIQGQALMDEGNDQDAVEMMEAGFEAVADLRDQEWPIEVSSAMETYFATIDTGGPNPFSDSFEEWELANGEIKVYLAEGCGLEEASLAVFFGE